MKLLDGLAFIGLRLPGSKRRAQLRSAWTHPGDADGWSASWYFDQIRKRLNPAAVVDEKTWSDLEFPRFFKEIDTTVSLIGRQYLFAQLRIYEYEKVELDECHHGYEILQGNRVVGQFLLQRLQSCSCDVCEKLERRSARNSR